MIGLGRVVGMETDISGGRTFTIGTERWSGNTSKAIARITYAREHVYQLLILHKVKNHFVYTVHRTCVGVTAYVTVELDQNKFVPVVRSVEHIHTVWNEAPGWDAAYLEFD